MLIRILPSLLLLIALCAGVSAQAPDPNVVIPTDWYDGLQYRSAGPTRGGRATAIAGVPGKPHTFYFGATGGGVWKTDDAGQSWANLSDGQIAAGSIGAIAVAPSDPEVLYVGTGSACPRGNVSAGIGMYKSTDGGRSWVFAGLPRAGQIGRILVHPQNAEVAYVAALGQIFGKNRERGVYRTRDGGKTWEQVLFVSDSTGAVDLAMNPHNPRELYAAMWRAERKPYTLIDGGPEGGIWKSTDGGNTWTKLGGGLPTGLIGRIGVAVSPANPNRVWALLETTKEEEGGMWRSDDAGQTWKRICRNHHLRQRNWYYAHVTADPKDENTVYVNNVDFWKSIDGGRTFDIEISTPHGDHHGLWINPDNPDIMINCNDGGACVSLNGGRTWTTQLNQPTAEFYRVTVDGQFPYRLYAGQQDNSTIAVPGHALPAVTPSEHWHAVGGSESADVGVNPQNPNIVWATSYSGEITITDLATGYQREVTPYPHYTEGTEQRALKYRFQWNAPVLVSAHDPNTVYHASQYVHRTRNDGQSWDIISPDLTRAIDKYHDIPGGPIQHDATGVEVYCSIFALEESPHQAGELWAGTDDGRVHITRDGGRTWQEITPRGMPREGTVNKIELSPHAPGRAFMAVINYRYDDFRPYVYRTTDYGKTWTLLTDGKNGIPANHFVRAIAEDPDRRGLLYAGAEYGMYVSFDDGAHWQSLQLNLPVVPITDLEVHDKDLVLSTQGRAFWVLDDLTPLHQLTPDLARGGPHFFRPRDAYRTNVAGYQPRFHVYLPEEPAAGAPLTLEILDAGGQVVRTYDAASSNRRDKISLKKGFNTLSWDLYHRGPELVENLVAMVIRNPSPGPRAAPGNYQARLTVGDWSTTQPFTVRADPRWTHVTDADYAAQLALGIELRDLITDAQRRIRNLRAVREQINAVADLAARAGHSAELKKLAKEIAARLTAVEDELIQNKAEASQDNINYPRVFTNRIGRLYSVVVFEDHRPTGGALERYADLKELYAGITSRYDQVMQEALPTFNAMLEKEKVGRIVVPEKVDVNRK